MGAGGVHSESLTCVDDFDTAPAILSRASISNVYTPSR